MHAWEGLLPQLSNRFATFGTTSQGDHFGRFDNDLYFHPVRMGSYFIWNNVLQLRFYLFFDSEGRHAIPSVESLGDLLGSRRRSYNLWIPKSVRDRPEVRSTTQKLREKLGWRQPQIIYYWMENSRILPAWAPRSWAETCFLVFPSRRNGPEGYDWIAQGSGMLGALDFLLHLSELIRNSSLR